MSQGKWIPKDCTDKRCLKGTMCRQAAWGQYTIVCKALNNPFFEDGVCPFYKTRQQYAEEYKASNTFKIDPYINPN